MCCWDQWCLFDLGFYNCCCSGRCYNCWHWWTVWQLVQQWDYCSSCSCHESWPRASGDSSEDSGTGTPTSTGQRPADTFFHCCSRCWVPLLWWQAWWHHCCRFIYQEWWWWMRHSRVYIFLYFNFIALQVRLFVESNSSLCHYTGVLCPPLM